MTISEQINDLINTIRPRVAQMLPPECSQHQLDLALLLPSLGVLEAEADSECKKIQFEFMREGHNVSAAKVAMEATDPYLAYRKIHLTRLAVEEVIKSLKARIKALTTEEQFTPR